MTTHAWELAAFAASLLALPPLVFVAAVLLDHLLHGPNRAPRGGAR